MTPQIKTHLETIATEFDMSIIFEDMSARLEFKDSEAGMTLTEPMSYDTLDEITHSFSIFWNIIQKGKDSDRRHNKIRDVGKRLHGDDFKWAGHREAA